MATGKVQIHSENILPIIKKWLYSEKDIFVRELVSNACDAIQKANILHDRKECIVDSPHRIDIKQDKVSKTITFSDTGLGLDAEETEKFLAQIAFSGAEEFIKAYQLNDPFIGHFGLGFYSSFMAADSVEVHSRSYKEGAKAVVWKSDGSATYEVLDGARQTRGTDIILHINSENEEFLDEMKLEEILQRYSAFLPYSIYLNDKLINGKDPLWQKMPTDCSQKDYITFFRQLYPLEEEPLFWIHLNVDYPFHVKGILYFPRLKKDFDPSKNGVKLFCNRVFVSDDCKDILPEYLTMLKGAIDSPDIPLNVSRSYLQVDKTVRALASHISKKVVDALANLYKHDKARFFEIWKDAELVVKLGILQDEKFYSRAKEFLVWKTAQDSWLTIDEYLEMHKEKAENSIFYAQDTAFSPQLLELYKAKGLDVLISSSPIDAPIMSYLERQYPNVHFKRIDAGIDRALLDPDKEKTILDAQGKTESSKIAEFVKATLNEESITVEAKSLASSDVSGFITLSEDERRLRDYMMRITPEEVAQKLAKMTFVVNTNSPLVTTIFEIREKRPDLAKSMIRQVYDLALLSQKEMDVKSFQTFITRTSSLLEKMALELK